jgi:hypothetical protein
MSFGASEVVEVTAILVPGIVLSIPDASPSTGSGRPHRDRRR